MLLTVQTVIADNGFKVTVTVIVHITVLKIHALITVTAIASFAHALAGKIEKVNYDF
jgi:uncharacterized protein YkvS